MNNVPLSHLDGIRSGRNTDALPDPPLARKSVLGLRVSRPQKPQAQANCVSRHSWVQGWGVVYVIKSPESEPQVGNMLLDTE